MTGDKPIHSSNMLHSFYYSNKMGKVVGAETPKQPNRAGREFLDYADKPSLKPTPITKGIDENGNPYSIGLEVHPIQEVIPRVPIPDINFKSLQIWLDNLGQAIYNPLLCVQTPDGEFYSNRDGDHRSRCLWEIGEPEIRLIVRKASDTKVSGIKRSDWLQWLREYLPLNTYPTATPYMFGTSRNKWKRIYRRYYPPLWQPSPVLQEYFNEPKNDGRFFKDTLFNTWSFRDIYSQWGQTAYRIDIIDSILRNADIEGKSVLDIGAYYGWATLMLLEMGVRTATALELNKHRCEVIKHIAATRAYPVTVVNDVIQNYISEMGHFDIILLLNVFHHILHQTKGAWDILNSLIESCGKMFLMMDAKPQWGILSEWDNDVEKALTSQLINAKITPLFKTSYRNRVLYMIEGIKCSP